MTDETISTTSAVALEPPRPLGSNAPPKHLPSGHQVQQYLWENSKRESVKGCGRALIEQDFSILFTPDMVKFKGLMTCGATWLCPSCAERETLRRTLETEAAMALWEARGGRVMFITLTLPHHSGDPLRPMLNLLSTSRAKVIKGSPWKNRMTSLGSPGFIWSLEVTHGCNGWHPHLHIALFVGPDATTEQMEAFSDWLINRWVSKVTEAGGLKPSKKAQKVMLPRPYDSERHHEVPDGSAGERTASAALADYLHKAPSGSLGRQKSASVKPTTSKGESKQTWEKTVSHWEVLRRAASGDKKAQRLWKDFEKATKGKRQVPWSEHLRANLGLTSSGKTMSAPTVDVHSESDSEGTGSVPSARPSHRGGRGPGGCTRLRDRGPDLSPTRPLVPESHPRHQGCGLEGARPPPFLPPASPPSLPRATARRITHLRDGAARHHGHHHLDWVRAA